MKKDTTQGKPPAVTLYTDGACEPNPGPGGWAAILKRGGRVQELAGFEPDTTNNRMELRAAIEGLRALKTPAHVVLVTDSEYVMRGMTEWMPSWLKRRKKPLNWDLWRQLVEAARPHKVTWRWVRGHTGDPLNERADRLAYSKIAGG